jgi:hypothetical protein
MNAEPAEHAEKTPIFFWGFRELCVECRGLELAAGGDPTVGRPGNGGRQFGRLVIGSMARLAAQPARRD